MTTTRERAYAPGRDEFGRGRRDGRGPRRPRLADSRRRGRAMFIATLFVFSVFAAQLVRLQGVDAAAVAAEGREMRRLGGTTAIPASRGQILDTNGVVLATTIQRYDVAADPENIKQFVARDASGQVRTDAAGVELRGARGAAALLAPKLAMTTADLVPLLSPKTLADGKASRYQLLKKKIEPLLWRDIDDLGIPGISAAVVQERLYPGGASVAPLIGWTGVDGRAKTGDGGGLELLYDQALTGKAGSMSAEYSLDGQVIPMAERVVVPAVPGRDIRLTIDADLQWYAYNQIADQVKASKANWGTVVCEDTQGRLRVATQYPSFDPTNRGAEGAVMRSLPFEDVVEPGSTAKVMSLGSSLNEGVVSPTTPLTVPGVLPRSDAAFKDFSAHGTLYLTAAGILAVSSNIGTIMIAEKLSPQKIDDYYRKFGMGTKSATGFPGESAGIIHAPNAPAYSGTTRFTMLFGQGFSLTPVQSTGVFQAVANGGVRMPATLVEGTYAADGTFAPTALPQGIRVLAPEPNAALIKMMENVTNQGGTATLADIPGYRVAGKTGTADRPVNGRLQGITAAFIGIAPADKPSLVCSVIVDNPKGSAHGGDFTTPVFQSVMTYALQRNKVPPTGVPLAPYPNWWGKDASKNPR